MDYSKEIHTASLALSILQQSSLPSQSFVFSPFSLNTALAIVHDGGNGETQKELTNLLLNGSNPSDVTEYYSSRILSLPSSSLNGVTFTSANKFYVDNSISLKSDYQKHTEDAYKTNVQSINLNNAVDAAREMNKFVEETTNGKIKEALNADEISGAVAILINTVYFLGKWDYPFHPRATEPGEFHGYNGARTIDFMRKPATTFRVNLENDIGTVLTMPYKEKHYEFFYIMPSESSNIERMRNELTVDKLVDVLKNAENKKVKIAVPKFKIESNLDVLKKLGVTRVFEGKADLSKISATPLHVSKIKHSALIEVDELGTEAAAATLVYMAAGCCRIETPPPSILIDRPFLFGVVRNNDIIFMGQFV